MKTKISDDIKAKIKLLGELAEAESVEWRLKGDADWKHLDQLHNHALYNIYDDSAQYRVAPPKPAPQPRLPDVPVFWVRRPGGYVFIPSILGEEDECISTPLGTRYTLNHQGLAWSADRKTWYTFTDHENPVKE